MPSAIPKLSKLQEILSLGADHWDHESYDPDSRRAFRRAMQCRTPALGSRLFASENEEQVFCNTCKSPACSSCGHCSTIQWQRQRFCALPEGPYLGITLTMPDTLWPVFARNPQLCRKLPEIAARVIGSYARVHYGTEVGVMAALHTFNAELRFNSHVHALVTAGGLQTSGSAWRPRVFFDRNKLVRTWQRLVIALLRGTLSTRQFNAGMSSNELENMLQHEEQRGWIAHVQAFRGKEHFLRYAGRYVRRPPIAQRRIVAIEEGFVQFWCKDKRLRRQILVHCTIEEFIDRWSQHIPRRYRHAVRHFGLFAPRRWTRVAATVFANLGTKQRPRPKRLPWALAIQSQFGHDPQRDKNGQLMRFVRHLAPAEV